VKSLSKFVRQPGETDEQAKKRIAATYKQLLKNHEKYVIAKAKVDAEAIQRHQEICNLRLQMR
jgi:hypothetical protein